MTEEFLRDAEQQLQTLDPQLGALIRAQPLQPRPRRTDYFSSLCRSIVGQQVSVKAAAAIFGRLRAATGLMPARVLAIDDVQTKEIGLSKQKTAYIKDLAGHFLADPAVYDHLERQDDDQVIRELTAVKGIGIWTAQMFLMFTLARPDVFAPDDVGLQRAMLRLYDWETLPPKRELEAAALRWRPFRTVASLHLWQSLDNAPAP